MRRPGTSASPRPPCSASASSISCARRRPSLNIIIKPHPVIGDWRPRWMAGWARLAAAHRGVHLVEDTHADVVPYLLASDVLLSDASSVVFEFLALDRPIVLVTNPRHRADPAWLDDDIVWRWRDLGHEIGDAGELPAAVAAALARPGGAWRAPPELCADPLRPLHGRAERRTRRRAHPGRGPPSRARRARARPPRPPRRGAGTTCAPGSGSTRRSADSRSAPSSACGSASARGARAHRCRDSSQSSGR